MTLHNLAVLYQSEGRYTEAVPLYERGQILFEKALGKSHPKAVACRKSYARLRRALGGECG